LLSENLNKEQQEKLEAFARADRLTDNVGVLGQGVSELGQGVNQLGQGVSQIGQGVNQLGREVTTLSQSSEAIKKEIEAARPQTMSEIFTRFQKNRDTIRFNSREQGLFGGTVERSYESRSILVNGPDDTVYLVTHSSNSPFSLSKSSSLESVSLTVTTGAGSLSVNQIGFLAADPRLIFIPLAKIYVENSGLETFPLALQPERWEEAVLIKNDESNFGRTEFRRLTSSARFLRMERPALGELFSDFAASRGDLAFTKNSQFMGILTDTEHAVVIDDFLAAAITQLGSEFNTQNNADTMDRLRDRVQQLPQKIR
jgi:X-X-X-Leu-X-X-Gly heptad repeat protein